MIGGAGGAADAARDAVRRYALMVVGRGNGPGGKDTPTGTEVVA